MKRLILIIFLLSCSLVYFISCSKKDDSNPASATCTDGIQNQGETGVDCGGPCPACPACNDGIQNQGETDIDCGGPCPACPACSDGIQNQGETGIDCGGPCPACETCSDGIQNQGETGIDCGGPCPPCNLCNNDLMDAGEIEIDCGGTCPPCPVPLMSCKIDGISWTASNVIIVYGGGSYVLTGENSTLDTVITIVLGSAPQTGNFPLGAFGPNPCFLQIGTITHTGISGTLDIDVWNQGKHRVTGTFDFVTGIDVTDGMFENVYYQ